MGKAGRGDGGAMTVDEKREASSEKREGGILNGLRLLVVADSSTTHTHRWAHWARDGGANVSVLSPFADPIAIACDRLDVFRGQTIGVPGGLMSGYVPEYHAGAAAD